MLSTGYNTYIVAACIGLVSAAKAMGFVSEAVAETLIQLLVGGGLMTLRAGLKTESQKTVNAVAVVGAEVGVSPGTVQAASEKVEPVAATALPHISSPRG